MSRFPTSCRGSLRATLRRVHPVDRSLLLLMLLLLAQSAFSLFFPGEEGSAARDIDIIVRTASAAIFGYFLSANFIRSAPSPQAPQSPPVHILEREPAPSERTDAPAARLGFFADEPPAPPGPEPAFSDAPASADAYESCLQITIATGIGIFCLLVLLLLRNLSQLGILAIADPVSGTLTQFRDFVSGCVGFLIGSPTGSEPPASSSI